MLLQNSLSDKFDLYYGFRIAYEGNEYIYFTYYPSTKKLHYHREKDGKITEDYDLNNNNSEDTAAVTNSGDLKYSDIYFIIKKQDVITGHKGNRYYIPCYFYSGYITNDGTEKNTEETIDMELEFEN